MIASSKIQKLEALADRDSGATNEERDTALRMIVKLHGIEEDYIIFDDDIEKATHWIAFEDNKWDFLKNKVTAGRIYKLELLKEKLINYWGNEIEDEDYFIKDDEGRYGMHYMIHKGVLVNMETKLLN